MVERCKLPKKFRRIFYVYEHWRPDKDICFWVGKGKETRAYEFKRNRYYNNVVNKLARLGMCVEIRMVAQSLIESEAFTLEKERIAFWRSLGVKLTNKTDGGEGISGFNHSAKTCAILSAQRKGKSNPAHSAKMRGRKLSEEHKKNIGLGLLGHECLQVTKTKISIGNSGKIRSEEIKLKWSLSHLGRKDSEKTIEKRTNSLFQYWKNHPEAKITRSLAVLKAYENPQVREKQKKGRNRYNSDPKFAEDRSESTRRGWETRRRKLVGG
jgi:hypothetical protein